MKIRRMSIVIAVVLSVILNTSDGNSEPNYLIGNHVENNIKIDSDKKINLNYSKRSEEEDKKLNKQNTIILIVMSVIMSSLIVTYAVRNN